MFVGLTALTPMAYAQTPEPPKGKMPIIVIPGITGSELVNRNTGKTAWFKTTRAKDDDVRLPMSPNLARNSDNLIAGDISERSGSPGFCPR